MEKKEKKTKKKDKVKESEDTQKPNKITKQERKSNISVCEFTEQYLVPKGEKHFYCALL